MASTSPVPPRGTHPYWTRAGAGATTQSIGRSWGMPERNRPRTVTPAEPSGRELTHPRGPAPARRGCATSGSSSSLTDRWAVPAAHARNRPGGTPTRRVNCVVKVPKLEYPTAMLISVTVFGVSTSRRLASAIRTAARKRPGVTEVTPWNTRWKWNGLRYAACARSRRLCGSPRRSRIAVSARTTASTRAVAVGPFGTVSRPRPGHVGALVSIMRARRRPSSGGGPAPAPRAVARQHRTLGARWALVQVDGHDHRHGHDRVVEQVQLDTWEPELEHAGGHRPAEQVPARDRLAEQEQVLEVVPELDHESDGPPPTRPPDERRPQQRQPQQHDGREPVVQLLGPEQPGDGLAEETSRLRAWPVQDPDLPGLGEVLEPVPGDDRHEDQQHRTVQRSVQAPCEGPTRQRDDVWLGGHLRLLLLATILVSRVVKVRGQALVALGEIQQRVAPVGGRGPGHPPEHHVVVAGLGHVSQTAVQPREAACEHRRTGQRGRPPIDHVELLRAARTAWIREIPRERLLVRGEHGYGERSGPQDHLAHQRVPPDAHERERRHQRHRSERIGGHPAHAVAVPRPDHGDAGGVQREGRAQLGLDGAAGKAGKAGRRDPLDQVIHVQPRPGTAPRRAAGRGARAPGRARRSLGACTRRAGCPWPRAGRPLQAAGARTRIPG